MKISTKKKFEDCFNIPSPDEMAKMIEKLETNGIEIPNNFFELVVKEIKQRQR